MAAAVITWREAWARESGDGGGGDDGTTHYITQSGYDYTPFVLDVEPGDTVIWTWGGGNHDCVSGANCTPDGIWFDLPLNSANPEAVWTVDAPAGTEIEYHCTVGTHCFQGMRDRRETHNGIFCDEACLSWKHLRKLYATDAPVIQ